MSVDAIDIPDMTNEQLRDFINRQKRYFNKLDSMSHPESGVPLPDKWGDEIDAAEWWIRMAESELERRR